MKTRIQELRKEKNISQIQLAMKIGTTQATLSKIENGICIPDAELIIRIAGYFHVSTDYLLYLTDCKTPHSGDAKNMSDGKSDIKVLNLYQKMSQRQRLALYQFLNSLVTVETEEK